MSADTEPGYYKVDFGDPTKPLTAAEHTVMTGPWTKEEAAVLQGPTIIADDDNCPIVCPTCDSGKGDELMGVVVTKE